MKQTILRYFMSSIITFLAGVAMVLLASWDQITLESFKTGAIAGVAFLAIRAGVKALIEMFLTWYTSNK